MDALDAAFYATFKKVEPCGNPESFRGWPWTSAVRWVGRAAQAAACNAVPTRRERNYGTGLHFQPLIHANPR